MSADDERAAAEGEPVERPGPSAVPAGRPAAEDAAPAGEAVEQDLVRPAASAARRVDPEDWSRSGEDDDRYLRERPPHWD